MRSFLIGLLFCSAFFAQGIQAQPLVRAVPDGQPLSKKILPDSADPPSQPESRLTDVHAERPFIFWIGAGFGYGTAGRICEACDEARHPDGSTFQGALGFALNKRLLVGLETGIWVNGWGGFNSKGKKIYRNHFMLMSYWYPLRGTPIFTKIGVGLSSYTAYDRYVPYTNFLPSEVHGEGLGLAAGIGYDFKVTRQLYISPAITYCHGFLGDLELNNSSTIARNSKLNLVTFNAALTFRATK